MACRICKRGGCTESFHSFEEQEAEDEDGQSERIAELEEEVRRLKSLAQSLNAGIEELPGWAALRVSAMCASPCASASTGDEK